MLLSDIAACKFASSRLSCLLTGQPRPTVFPLDGLRLGFALRAADCNLLPMFYG